MMNFSKGQFLKVIDRSILYQNEFLNSSLEKQDKDENLQSQQILSINYNNYKTFKMKCVSIVYKRPSVSQQFTSLAPQRPVKRSVDDYMQKLKEKQEQQKFNIMTQHKLTPRRLNSVQSIQRPKYNPNNLMTQSINILKMKCPEIHLFENDTNQDFLQRKQKKFRTTFVKRKTSSSSSLYTLKGIQTQNNGLFSPIQFQHKSNTDMKHCSKLQNLSKLKLSKPSTILISIDFILNENNFWQQQKIDEIAHKNWKALQQHSNVIWITKRQNSASKLEKYASQNNLRLDGVYKIIPYKKGKSLKLSLLAFQKDFKIQSQGPNKKELKRQLIVINSLKFDSLKEVSYQQFYNSFPITKQLRCIVHFVQTDTCDKYRFNSVLKILSKQKLPTPNSVNHIFKQFQIDNPLHNSQQNLQQINSMSQQNQEQFTKQQMLERYEDIKKQITDYFCQQMKVSLNKKVTVDDSEMSLQFLIGDILKRNFNILYNYIKSSQKIHSQLNRVINNFEIYQHQNNSKEIVKTHENNLFQKTPLKIQDKTAFEELIKSKLRKPEKISNKLSNQSSPNENSFSYKNPVFLWKK